MGEHKWSAGDEAYWYDQAAGFVRRGIVMAVDEHGRPQAACGTACSDECPVYPTPTGAERERAHCLRLRAKMMESRARKLWDLADALDIEADRRAGAAQ